MQLKRHSKNVHEISLKGKSVRIAMLSDLHWDNPKSDRDLLKKHLDYCLQNEIPVMVNGDFFCLMQGRGDRRSNKSDIRPEHNNARYLDSVVETAVEWFTPYAHIIALIGYGNHETAIIKWQETDLLQRFVTLLNFKTKANVQIGGYGGWLIVRQEYDIHSFSTWKIKYFHGSGGGGVVTKGAINLTRALELYEDFDVFTMGHIHENACRNDVRDTLLHRPKKGYFNYQKQIHLMLTGTYKEEYGDGSKGWHVERGAPAKPVGGRLLKFSIGFRYPDGEKITLKDVDSQKFEI